METSKTVEKTIPSFEERQQLLKETKTKVSFFYDQHNQPRVVRVDLLSTGEEEKKTLASGLAFCSIKDNPVKKYGIHKARKRAVKAFMLAQNHSPINFSNINMEEILKRLNLTDFFNKFLHPTEYDFKGIFFSHK